MLSGTANAPLFGTERYGTSTFGRLNSKQEYTTAQEGHGAVLNRKKARREGCKINLNTHGTMYGDGAHLVHKSIWIHDT